MQITTFKFKTYLTCMAFSLFCSLSFADAEQNEYELSEELALYVLDVYPGHQKRSDEEWIPIEAKVKEFLVKGADPDLYIHKARGTALGATVGPAVQERLFFVVAPHSQELSMAHYRKEYPIELAFRHRSLRAIKYLVGRGADVDGSKCCHQRIHMPFIYSAAFKNDFELVTQLLGLGADINIEHRQSNPLRSSIKGERYEMVKFLIARGAIGADFPILHDAILRNAPVEILQAIINLGYSPWSISAQGESAIEYARKRGKSEAVELLEEYIHTERK